MKKCFKCGEIKDYSEFYKHKQMGDGYLNKCKECTKMDSRKNRKENLEYYQEYDRLRGWNRSKKYKLYKTESAKNSNKKWNENNKLKKYAHSRLQRAITKGIILKMPCEICGDTNSNAHHEDYNQPLVVIWLCTKHHAWIHCKVKNGGREQKFERKGYKKRSDNWYAAQSFRRKVKQDE